MPTRQETQDLIYLAAAGRDSACCPEGFADQGWRIREADGVEGVLALLEAHPVSCFAGLLDLRGGMEPQQAARLVERLTPALTTARIGWVAGVLPEQLKLGWVRQLIHDYCHDYVTLPCGDPLLGVVLGHAFGMAALLPGDRRDVPAGAGLDGMVGESPAMQAMFRRLRRAAMSDAPVYIAGETGTGKELAAMAVHRYSSRHDKPFVAINCGAIPQSLVQSELFGFERGAFTGATQRKPGRIELAHRGTLFLDEIGDLPMESQASLLRFLQQGSIERLGGHDEIQVDVRIISATHVDLMVAVAEGRFREDLFHRLHVIELEQPPLRERGNDIPLIANHALERYAGERRHKLKGFTQCALQALHRYEWPGNVRELINRVRQAGIMADGRYITADDLRIGETENLDAHTLDAARCQAERAAIERALQRNGHRLVATARDLEISRVTLYRLMIRHGLRDSDDLDATRIG